VATIAALVAPTTLLLAGRGVAEVPAPADAEPIGDTSPIAPDTAQLDVTLVAADTGTRPLGAPVSFVIHVLNRASRSMSVPIDLTIGAVSGPDGGTVARGSDASTREPVQFYSTQLFVTAGGESAEDVLVTPSQWYGSPGRYAVTASVGGQRIGDPLPVDVGDPDVIVPRFREVSADAGIVATVPDAECGQFSNGAAWADIDGDDDLDVLVTRLGDPMALFVNDGSGHFTDDAPARGLGFGDANNVAFADYDNDGDADVIVVRDGSDRLLENDGVGHFTDVSERAGIGDDDRRGMDASWADFDGDGLLDVYVTNYMHCLGEWRTEEEVISQVGYDRDTLYRNNGDGTFTDVTEYLEHDPDDYDDGTTIGAGFGASWFDYDGDGRLDLYLANDFVGPLPDYNHMWHNDGPRDDGSWGFTDVSLDTGTALFMNTMGIGVGDPDRDGDFDMALTNITANKLMRNEGGTFTEDQGAGIGRPSQEGTYASVTWGAVFGDYNLDGWEDVYVSAGNLQQAPGVPTGVQPNEVFVNDGTGARFLDVSAATGADDRGESKGVAVADYDRDGDLDVLVVNQGGTARLYENVTPRGDRSWLTVTLEGTTSARDACGAVVRLDVDGGAMTRGVTCGSGGGGSGSDHSVHFGIPAGASAATLTITWPSGRVQDLGVAAFGQRVTVEEPSA
jgi:enediyne biosynthesis protein E4